MFFLYPACKLVAINSASRRAKLKFYFWTGNIITQIYTKVIPLVKGKVSSDKVSTKDRACWFYANNRALQQRWNFFLHREITKCSGRDNFPRHVHVSGREYAWESSRIYLSALLENRPWRRVLLIEYLATSTFGNSLDRSARRPCHFSSSSFQFHTARRKLPRVIIVINLCSCVAKLSQALTREKFYTQVG